MPSRFHLLPWDQPLLKRAVDWLAAAATAGRAGEWRGGGPLDLSDLLVVVPTRQSGRRLREALAVYAAERGQGVFAPQVMLPERLATLGLPAAAVALPIESLLAWIEVLRGLDLAVFREVFPVDPPARTFPWALRLAGEFVRLQKALGEAGLGFVDVSARAGDDFQESARWRQLAQLERLYTARLEARGRRDLQAARIAFARNPAPPPGVTRIVLLATPDPLPLAATVLAAHARILSVDVVVFGPPGGESLFDEWGRPRIEAWSARETALPDFERQVHVCADPMAQAERVAGCARRYGKPDGWLGVGVADSDVLPFLENSLTRSDIAVFNPEGRPRRREGFFALLEALAALARPGDPGFAAIASLARCPDVLAWLGAPPARLLAGLDELHRRHLPATLGAAQAHAAGLEDEFPELVPALEKLAGLRATLVHGAFPANAAAALAAIFKDRRADLSDAGDARLADTAEAWREILRQAGAAGQQSLPAARTLTTEDWWELALRLLGEDRQFEDKPDGAVELQGWLELLWEDAPHLVVTGCNDGRVPEAVVGDPFLPEALRERLGLKTNAARFARDAYFLQAMIACRAEGGRLDLLLGKVSAAGDPLRPSRLLLRCPDSGLPRRVAFLFRPAEVARASQPWKRAWRLRRPAAAAGPPAQIYVTAFRDYLRCPFRFCLRRVLGTEAVDPEKIELDAADFGSLCHAALEAMGREPSLRDCTDARTLREFLLADLEREARARYGTELSLPLVVQLESARQRLARAAEVQARERAAGWVIQEVEWRFPAEPALVFGGLAVLGRIDRLDRHAETGEWRVLDYKTSDQPVGPREAHCRAARSGAPEFARFAMDGRDLEWTDLQLPLYLQAAATRIPANAACGYFHLPKAVGETRVELWKGYSADWQTAAMRCAEEAAAAIRAGRFWPPAEDVPHDDFAELFHHGAAESVAAEAFTGAETGETAP